MSVRDQLIAKLNARFDPDYLEVIDESERHRGHAGYREGGESHFRVRIGTRHFDGLSRLAQHRLVMETLDDDIKAGIHALAIEVTGPEGPVRAAGPR